MLQDGIPLTAIQPLILPLKYLAQKQTESINPVEITLARSSLIVGVYQDMRPFTQWMVKFL